MNSKYFFCVVSGFTYNFNEPVGYVYFENSLEFVSPCISNVKTYIYFYAPSHAVHATFSLTSEYTYPYYGSNAALHIFNTICLICRENQKRPVTLMVGADPPPFPINTIIC